MHALIDIELMKRRESEEERERYSMFFTDLLRGYNFAEALRAHGRKDIVEVLRKNVEDQARGFPHPRVEGIKIVWTKPLHTEGASSGSVLDRFEEIEIG